MNSFIQKFSKANAILLFLGFGLISGQTQAQNCDGGMVQTPNGMTKVEICKNANPSVISFDSMNVSGANFRYIVTDVNDTVLRVKTADMQNFNGAPAGECHVYGFAYDGSLQNANKGNHISEVSASNCDSLSRNYITVIRNHTDGGMVQTENSQDTVEYCLGESDKVNFDSVKVDGMNYRYIITNVEDTVLNPNAPNKASFDAAPPGECHVYGVAYKGNLNASKGMDISSVKATICDSLSRNYITILRDTIDGGSVQTTTGKDTVEVMIDDQKDIINFQTTSMTMKNNYRYIITDANDSILNPDAGTSQNFNPAGTGECHVFGVAYQGTLNASKGMAISNISATECMEMADNPIVVNRVKGTSSVQNINAKTQDLSVYPNPAKDNLNVKIRSTKSGSATLIIQDLSGQTVLKEQKGLNEGQNSFNLNLSPNWQGTYMISVIRNGKVNHNRLIVK